MSRAIISGSAAAVIFGGLLILGSVMDNSLIWSSRLALFVIGLFFVLAGLWFSKG